MSCYERWTIIVQTLGVIATLLLAVVAIWGDWLRALLVAPRLRLKLRQKEGEITTLSDGTPIRYYHLDTQNDLTAIPAKNVSVFLIGACRPGSDGAWQSAFPCGPISLIWQYGIQGPHTLGPPRVCDLGSIAKGGDFKLELPFVPNNLNHIIGANDRLRVRLMAVAEDARPAFLHIEIDWDGAWVDGDTEMTKHLVIKPLDN